MDRRVAYVAIAAVSVAAGVVGVRYGLRPRDQAVAVDTVVVSGNDLTVTVLAGAPPCADRLRVAVTESEREVRLAATVRRDPDATCPSILHRHTTRVTLAAPLGDRPVVDDKSDVGVVVSGRP